MARPFKYPEVPKLAVGEHVVLHTSESLGSVMRRCALHAKRTGKAFAYIAPSEGQVQVARLDDPQ